MYGCFYKNRSYNIFYGAYNIWQISKGDFVKRSAIPHTDENQKEKTASKKIITGLILCITIALCNGWKPPDSLDKAREQSEIFVIYFYIYRRKYKNFSENISEAISTQLIKYWSRQEIRPEDRMQIFRWKIYRNTVEVLV